MQGPESRTTPLLSESHHRELILWLSIRILFRRLPQRSQVNVGREQVLYLSQTIRLRCILRKKDEYHQSNLVHKNVSKNIYRIVQYLGGDSAIAAVDVGTSAPPTSTLSADPLLKPLISFKCYYLAENRTLNVLLYKGSSICCLGNIVSV